MADPKKELSQAQKALVARAQQNVLGFSTMADSSTVDKLAAQGEWPQFRHDITPMSRHFSSGTTLGVSEFLLKNLGGYEALPEADFISPENLAQMAGSLIPGVGVARGVKAAAGQLPSALRGATAQAPRAERVLRGSAEGAIQGGAQAGFEGGDVSDIAMGATAEAALGATMEGSLSVLGHLYNKGMYLIAGPKKIPAALDPTLRPGQAFNPPLHAHFKGMNEGLKQVAEKWGIPVLPGAVRPNSFMPQWLTEKAASASSATGHLRDLNRMIDEGFRLNLEKLAKSMSLADVSGPVKTGQIMQDHYTHIIDNELRGPASQMYEDMLGSGLGKLAIDGQPLAAQLWALLDERGLLGVQDPKANQVKRLISKLTEKPAGTVQVLDMHGRSMGPDEVQAIEFNVLWSEAKRIYPTRKGQWTPGDDAAAEANGLIKDFIKTKAEDADPLLKTIFDHADVLWRKAKVLEESKVGKTLRKKDPDDIVTALTENTTRLKEVEEILGVEVYQRLVQRKVLNLIGDSISDKTQQLEHGAFASALYNMGQTKGPNDEYLETLFKHSPEVLEHIRELEQLLNLYDEPRQLLPTGITGKGKSEQAGGAAEVQSAGAVLTSVRALTRLLAQFATGGRLGEVVSGAPAINPLLGGVRPALAAGSRPMQAVGHLRRGLSGGQAGERLLNGTQPQQ